jgi:predicted alpha/beta-hydrolase family hydrolase
MKTSEPFLDTTAGDSPVHGFLHCPDQPGGASIILTHGAGSNCKTPLLIALAEAFSASGLMVLRCDLPYRQARPSGPPPPGSAARDQAGLRAAVVSMRRIQAGRIFLGGHSYGGRQASILAASDPALSLPVDALLLLGYPLHPPQRPDDLRTRHFPDLKTPALFVHGAHDPHGSIDEIEDARKTIPTRTEVLALPTAGHELLNLRNRSELPQQVVSAFLAFVR